MSTSATSGTNQPVRLGNFFASFDTESVLNQIQAARLAPIQQLDAQQRTLARRKTAVTTLVTQFSTLLSRSNSLLSTTSASAKTATVSGAGVLAAAGPTAIPGSFTVAVTKLATGSSVTGSALTAAVDPASTLSSSNFGTAVTAGTFTMKAATGATVSITVDPATQSLDDIVTAINAQAGTSGITATLVNDGNGRLNVLQLTSTMGAIQLGSGSDTSNFLSATNLLASPGTTTRSSTAAIARLNFASPMATASFFGGAPAAGAHTLTINGVAIAYDAASDSMTDMINRINTSAAGVAASYDPVTDKIKLTQATFGSVAISLADDGAFLTTTGLVAATQTLGDNAEYSINGGATQYTTSNTVSLQNGVTVTLAATTGGTPATVSVSQDTASASALMQNFVSAYNALSTSLDDLTKGGTANPGVFSGDSGMLALKTTLRSLVMGSASNVTGRYPTLGGLGLSFGAVGSAVGSTTTLQFDATKFQAALQADPVSVQNALSTFKLTAALAAGGTSSLSGIAGTYTGDRAGAWVLTQGAAGAIAATFTPSDGSTPYTQNITVTANSTNSTLVPGITLSFGALQAGTSTINVTRSAASVVRQMKEFLDGQVGGQGTLSKRSDEFDAVSKDIDARRERIQSAVDSEIALLRKKFTAMEQALANSSSIKQALDKLNTSNSTNG